VSEPGLLPPPAPQESLWEQAPAWRNLTIAATLLTATAAALPLALPGQPDQAAQRPRAVESCAITFATEARPMGTGVVTGFENPDTARQRMLNNEKANGGPISPAFAGTPRAIVQMDGDGGSQIAVVPPGMEVHVGDRIAFNAIHRDAAAPCAFVPPLVTADNGPAPAMPTPLPVRQTPVAARAVSRPVPATQTACTLRPGPTAPQLMGIGTVVALEDHALALAAIQVTESRMGGKIDPAYIDNPRVIVESSTGQRKAFILPKGLQVNLGDRVTLQNGYRNLALPCNYVPVQIVSDIGPPPAANAPGTDAPPPN
jgi:hypothetical protein